MCFSSVSSRKFFFRASWLVLISFSSFSSFSKVACQSHASSNHSTAHFYSRYSPANHSADYCGRKYSSFLPYFCKFDSD